MTTEPASGPVALSAHRLDQAIATGLWLIALLPLFAHAAPVADSFRVPHEALIAGLAWLLAALLIGRRLGAGRQPLGGGKQLAGWLLGLFAWVALSTLTAYRPDASLSYALTFYAYGLFGLALTGWLSDAPGRARCVLAPLLTLFTLEVSLGLLQRTGVLAALAPPGGWGPLVGLVSSVVENGAPMGSLGHPNFYAECLALLIPVGVGVLLTPGRLWLRLALGAGVLVALGLLVATGTRAALLGLLLGGAIASVWVYGRAAFDPRRWGRAARLAACLGLVGLALAGALLGERLRAKLGEPVPGTLGYAATESREARRIQWGLALGLAAERPLTGQGLGGYKLRNVKTLETAYPEGPPPASVRQRFYQTHSEPLQLAVELGLGGVVLVLGAVWAWARRLGREKALVPALRFGLLWGALALAVASGFGFPLHVPHTALALTLVLALGASVPAQPEVAAWKPTRALDITLLVLLVAVLAVNYGVRPLYAAHAAQREGEEALLQGRNSDALPALLRADALQRYRANVRVGLLRAYIGLGRYGEAVALYEASGREGLGMDARYWYAMALSSIGRTAEARTAYQSVVTYFADDHAFDVESRKRLSELR